MTTDDSKAALAAALHVRYNHAAAPETGREVPHPHRIADHHIADATAILTALDGWTLVPSDEMTGTRALAWALELREAEVERLRTALGKVVMHLERGGDWTTMTPIIAALDAARAALAPPLDDIHGTPTFSG